MLTSTMRCGQVGTGVTRPDRGRWASTPGKWCIVEDSEGGTKGVTANGGRPTIVRRETNLKRKSTGRRSFGIYR